MGSALTVMLSLMRLLNIVAAITGIALLSSENIANVVSPTVLIGILLFGYFLASLNLDSASFRSNPFAINQPVTEIKLTPELRQKFMQNYRNPQDLEKNRTYWGPAIALGGLEGVPV